MNRFDKTKNIYMLEGALGRLGYDWWWHSFTGYHRQTGRPKTFFIEFFIINPELSKNKVVFGQERKNLEKHIRPSYVMIKVGAWGENAKQIHGFYPISDLKISKTELKLQVGDNFLSENLTKGMVALTKEESKAHPEYMCDFGTMTWDLKIDKQIPFNVGFGTSRILRKLNIFEMYWHAQGMKTYYEGTVIYDEEIYDIIPEKSYGYADKNWGTDFTSPWIWISSCHMRSLITGEQLNRSAFDIGGGRPKILNIPLNRKILTGFCYEGKNYEYNFTKLWTFSRTKFRVWETKTHIIWEVTAQNTTSLLRLKCSCKKSEMLLINYEAPDGSKKHDRLYNGGTGKGIAYLYRKRRGILRLVDQIAIKNIGCEFGQH